MSKRKHLEMLAIEGLAEVEDDFTRDQLLRKNAKLFNPTASPEELLRIEELYRGEIMLSRLRKANLDADEARRRLEETQGKPAIALVSKPRKRSGEYKAIDAALREIAKAKPHGHGEVFSQLEGRVPPSRSRPFARGWNAGFQQDPVRARAWLSKRWSSLGLPPFPRGPK